MPITRFDRAYHQRITEWIKRAEVKTTAEFVVAIEPWSGRYTDADCLFGALLAYALMIIMFAVPFEFNELGVAVNVPVFFLIGMQFSKHAPWLRRRLTTSKRRAAQVRAGAEAAFSRSRVYQTRGHTGVLVYFSLMERSVEVLPDSGILAGVPKDAWESQASALRAAAGADDPAEAFQKALEGLGETLDRHMPAGADNPDELSDEVQGTVE